MILNNYDNFESLQLIFEKTLNVSLLSEKINTCKLEEEAIKILGDMIKKDFDVYGVEDSTGKIIGYIEKQDIFENENGIVQNYYNKFESDDLLSDSTSLLKLLEVLGDKNRMFVLENNTVEKIVTLADLHKQPMRMLIFSFISILEMQLTSVVNDTYPNDSWTKLISAKRLNTAKEHYEKRVQNNEALTLIDNTQLCDKGSIIKKNQNLRKNLGFKEKKDCEYFFSKLEILRNNTAHSQKNIYDDNYELITLVLKIKAVIETIQTSTSEKYISN